ncbi:MAG: hypothetical protein P8K74_00680 [Flavobacteriaceae bacterium]|nr:hypothetical protein [Flavobacteriaceae bacterium]
MIRLLFTGFFIITGAIISNLFAPKIQLKTWYDFLQGILESFSFWNQVSFKDLVWLFFIYPFLLVSRGQLGDFIYQKIF